MTETGDHAAPAVANPPPAGGLVNSVVQALSILRFLARAGTPHGVTSIARAIETSPSSTFNICKTLTAEGFLHFDGTRKQYVLGPGAMELADAAFGEERVFARARESLDAIVKSFNVTSAFWRLTSDERLILTGMVEGRAMMRIQMTIGQRIPALSGAMGRCFAASNRLPNDILQRRFNAVRWQVKPDFDTYLSELEVVQEGGWAVDQDQFIRGVTTIASPILDKNGKIRFFIANSSFSGQIEMVDLPKIGRLTRKSAERVSKIIFG